MEVLAQCCLSTLVGLAHFTHSVVTNNSCLFVVTDCFVKTVYCIGDLNLVDNFLVYCVISHKNSVKDFMKCTI